MWWTTLTIFQQVAFIIAISATALLLLQIILMLVGSFGDVDAADGGMTDTIADGTDVDSAAMSDFDNDFGGIPDGVDDIIPHNISDSVTSSIDAFKAVGLRMLSLRSLVALLCIGSWVGYTCAFSMDWWAALLVGIGCGLVAALLMSFAMYKLEKLQCAGNINPSNAVNKIGEVYLRIPAKRAGVGKVNIYVQERLTEFNALTDDGEDIPTGSSIKVVALADQSGTLLVKRKIKDSIVIIDDGK